MHLDGRRKALALIALLSTLPVGTRSQAADSPASGEPVKATVDTSARAAAAAERGALVTYVNPESGMMALEPSFGSVPLELSAKVLDSLNTSTEGLTPVIVNGVTTIDLQGRFSSVWFTVTDSGGKAHAFCVTSLPPDVASAAKALRLKREGRYSSETKRVQ